MQMPQWLRGMFAKSPQKRDNYAATYGNANAQGFAGGAVGRLTASMAAWSGSVNSDLDGSLVIMRARARQMAQSNEYGKRFLSMCASNIIGRTGPKLQVRAYMATPDKNGAPVLDKTANDTIEIHWQRWGKTADITEVMDFAHLCRVATKSMARDGEALIRKVRRRDLPYGFALQLLEADRLDEGINVQLANGSVRQGVETDSTGRRVAYWIKERHPGESYAAGSSRAERVPASDIIHLYLPERAEQMRGYTWLHAILMRAHQLGGFNDAAVLAARIGASKIAALERTDDAIDATATMADGQIGGSLQMNIEAGEMFELPPGYKLNSWNPEYPHANYESFVKACMRGISAGLDVATHNLSGDMTDVNYSSARIAELGEREQWMVLQDWVIFRLIEPVYQEWLAIALLRGDIKFEQSGKALPADKLSKFVNASRFQGRRWRWVDPAKEISAATDAVSLGVTSRTRLAAEQGEDFDDLLDELKMEHAAMIAAGLDNEPAEPTPAEQSPEVLAAKEVARAHVRVAELARDSKKSEPASVVVHNNVQTPEVRVDVQPTNLTVESPQIHVDVQPTPVTVESPEVRVEAIMPTPDAPVVNVNVEAIMPDEIKMAISSMPDRETTTNIERNASGEIVKSVQIESDIH